MEYIEARTNSYIESKRDSIKTIIVVIRTQSKTEVISGVFEKNACSVQYFAHTEVISCE